MRPQPNRQPAINQFAFLTGQIDAGQGLDERADGLEVFLLEGEFTLAGQTARRTTAAESSVFNCAAP